MTGGSTRFSQEVSENFFTVPVLIKGHSWGLAINIKWIKDDVTLASQRKEVEETIGRQMKLYLKSFDGSALHYRSEIPTSSIAFNFAPNSGEFSGLIEYQKSLLSLSNKSYLNLGLAEDGQAEPDLLLRDILHISRTPTPSGGLRQC